MNIPDNWTFKNADIAESFDSHVREQLPWYNIATSMTAHFVRNYLPENGVFIDLGCSTGNISKACKETLITRKAEILNIDNSSEMIQRFTGIGKIINSNIEDFEIPEFDVCVMFLSMMFVPVRCRPDVISNLMKKCRKGGVIIIIDKVEPLGGYSGQVMNRLNLTNKLHSGCKPSDILDKELSLSGVQRPINTDLVNSFMKWFQVGEFCGWLYEAI